MALQWVQPNYTFATPVLGGQLTLGMGGFVGRSNTDLAGTLTTTLGPLVSVRTEDISSSVTGFGDLYPVAMLKWNHGVHNYMVYATGDIPVGAYDSNRLANLGIGHGAIDGGVGYTYLNPLTGLEFSFVTGLTGNFKNTATNYTNGVDWHTDWGASKFLSKQLFVGAVGYVYKQLSCDSGARRPCRLLPVARYRRRAAARLPLSSRRAHAGLSEPEGLQGICRGASSGRLERVADARVFAGCAR